MTTSLFASITSVRGMMLQRR